MARLMGLSVLLLCLPGAVLGARFQRGKALNGPGFLGSGHATRTKVAFLDAEAETSDGGAARNGTATGLNAAAQAAACALKQKTISCMPPHNLEEWKEHATCCLAHCGSFGDTCFDGCMKDCVKQPLVCTGLAMHNKCYSKCQELEGCNSCLGTVEAGNTAGCTSKCLKTFPAEVKGDKCKLR